MITSVEDFEHVLEPATTPDAPTLVLLHGTGADEYDLLPLGRALAPGAALLSPRGKVDENGLNRWFRRLREGVFDVEDVITRTDELADWLTVALEHYELDPRRVVISGFSNGANTGAALLLRRPGLAVGAVLFASGAPLQGREPDPVDLSGTQVFLGAGKVDPITTIDRTHLLAEQLTSRGADVVLDEHAGGHQIPAEQIVRAEEWFVGCGF